MRRWSSIPLCNGKVHPFRVKSPTDWSSRGKTPGRERLSGGASIIPAQRETTGRMRVGLHLRIKSDTRPDMPLPEFPSFPSFLVDVQHTQTQTDTHTHLHAYTHRHTPKATS